MTATVETIDVSGLPPHVEDRTSPIWWGNLLLLLIETTMFGLLVATYFYLRMNFTTWPPPRPELSLYATRPDLGFATANLVLLLASIVPMALADRACLRFDVTTVRITMLIMVLIGLVSIALRFLEFSALKFR